MATKINLASGEATAVYDDRFRPIFDALGKVEIRRASEVEYDVKTGEWFAKLLANGQEIARGRNRNEVIAQEVNYLEGA